MDSFFLNCFNTYQAKIRYKMQDNDIVSNKQDSFERILKSHYNKEQIIKIQNKDIELEISDSIILDHKLNQDYDEKYLFTPLSMETNVGDIFLWERTKTHWIVYAQYLTEKAYYKSIIKKANWCISWKDDNNIIQYQWAYVRGPVETKTNSITMKNKIYDLPNGTLSILMPLTDKTKIFTKYKTIMLNGKKWKISTDVDDVSTPQLVEMQLVQTQSSEYDDTKNNIVNGLLIPDYTFKPLFNTKINYGTTLDINDSLLLYKEGKIVPSDFSIVGVSGNPTIKGTKITFSQIKDYEFKVIYNQNKNVSQVFKVISVGFGSKTLVNKIIGQTEVKSLLSYKYYTEILDNRDSYKWEIEDNNKIIKNSAVDNNTIKLDFGRKTGVVKLLLYTNNTLSDTMEIKVNGTFE